MRQQVPQKMPSLPKQVRKRLGGTWELRSEEQEICTCYYWWWLLEGVSRVKLKNRSRKPQVGHFSKQAFFSLQNIAIQIWANAKDINPHPQNTWSVRMCHQSYFPKKSAHVQSTNNWLARFCILLLTANLYSSATPWTFQWNFTLGLSDAVRHLKGKLSVLSVLCSQLGNTWVEIPLVTGSGKYMDYK